MRQNYRDETKLEMTVRPGEQDTVPRCPLLLAVPPGQSQVVEVTQAAQDRPTVPDVLDDVPGNNQVVQQNESTRHYVPNVRLL